MTKPEKIPGSYRRLLRFAGQFRIYFYLSVIGFIVFSGMELLLATLLKYFINGLEGKPTDDFFWIGSDVTSSLLFVPIAVVAVSVLRNISMFVGNFYMSKFGLNVVTHLRKKVFSHMVMLPQSYYDKNNSGELVSLILYNIEQVTGSVTNALKILFRDGVSVIFFLGYLIYINWKLTLVFFALAPLLAAMVYLASNYFRKTSHRIQSTVSQVSHVSMETFQGIKLVKSYRGEAYENSRFDKATDENLKYATKFERVNALQTPALHTVIAIGLALIFWLVLKLWTGDAAEAVVYVTVTGLIAKPFRQLSTVNSIIQKGSAAADTIFATLDIPQEPNIGQHALENIKGRIEFDQVEFGYSDDSTALDKLSFTIEPGETVALVGESGSGKTTVASLLLRYYLTRGGDIRIDGHSLADISNQSLRGNIALVNQQTVLFNDTIKANIAYGEYLTPPTDAAIETAAEQAYAKHFIDELDEGFNTLVGEDGARLSGGQRQRIAIARALLKDAPILILDEATSALDNESEKQIQRALDELKQGRTTLVIAHRLSTIESADKIIVMQKGRVLEMGDHQSLMKKNGAYARLHASQGQLDSDHQP